MTLRLADVGKQIGGWYVIGGVVGCGGGAMGKSTADGTIVDVPCS